MGRAERKKTNGTKEIVFDAAKRRDFVTGFRKRKNERKQVARQRIAEEVRQEKLREREEKRELLRTNRAVGTSGFADEVEEGAQPEDQDDEDKIAPGSVLSTFIFQDTLTTTCVTSLDEGVSEEQRPTAPAVDGPKQTRGASGYTAPQKKKKFDLNLPLQNAIPGYKPTINKGAKKRKKSGDGKKRLVSKKEKAKNRAAARPQR